MRNITVLIDGNHKDLYLSENINVTPDSEIFVKYATIFWDYNNVIKNMNDTITFNGNLIRFYEGYWTFDMITKLRDVYVVYNETTNVHATLGGLYTAKNASGGCSVYSNYDLNLKKFAPLLGFDKDTVIVVKNQTISPNPVDLNRGLKYVTVSCDIVNEMRNVDTDGKRSYVIATLPVPRDTDMKRAITQYNNSDNRILVRDGCYNKLSFDVNTNIGDVNIGSILLELLIDDK